MTTPARHSDGFDPEPTTTFTRADLDDMAREHAEAVERNRVAAWREYVRDEPESAATELWPQHPSSCQDCGGTGMTVQGWTDKGGASEDQYGPCACEIAAVEMTFAADPADLDDGDASRIAGWDE